jgi:hypothetical protein
MERTGEQIIECLEMIKSKPNYPGCTEFSCMKVASGGMKLRGKRWHWWVLDKVLMLAYIGLLAWIVYIIFF